MHSARATTRTIVAARVCRPFVRGPYHYLNWFIKADVIRWNQVPLPRLALVAAVSAASTALYFYDFVWGFSVLLALSLMHVFLEFPLNSISLRDLGRIAGKSFKGSARPASS